MVPCGEAWGKVSCRANASLGGEMLIRRENASSAFSPLVLLIIDT